MKQIKISSFFSSSGSPRKRTFEESSPSSSQSCQNGIVKRSKTAKEKKTNKENGCRKLITAFTRRPTKDVLSPKKATDNIQSSPEKNRARRDLENEFSDVGFEEMEFESWHQTKSDLVLSQPVRCEVLHFTFNGQPAHEQIVQLRAIGSGKTGICKLRDMWIFINLNVGQTVCVKGFEVEGEWIVSGKDGFVVIEPDVVLPFTTIAQGMFCLRRGILSYRHRNMKSDSQAMLMGRIVHELFQTSLRKGLETEEEVTMVLNELLSSQKYLSEFYDKSLKLNDIRLEATSFIPNIVNFICTFMKGEGATSSNNFCGRLTEVIDVEQLVTSPNYGVQGRVDATVRVETNHLKRVNPLELKTGRASFSREHKIQVMMYTILLDEIVRNIDSGLLLYLRDGIIEEVKPDSREIRDFLMLRNEFVKYAKEETLLPDPIRSSSCSRCSHARLCKTYLRHDGSELLSANHPIRELNFSDIADSHVEYFVKWTKMLFLECSTESIVPNDVILEHEPIQIDEYYRHVFRSAGGRFPNQLGGSVEVGHPAQRGRVIDVSDNHIVVLLEKQLKLGECYRIEWLKSSIQYMHLSSLGLFLDEEYKRLRELIVDRVPPKFESGITKNLLGNDYVEIMKPLNREQRKAIFKVMTSKDYVLIRGPPGTGKTETIVSLIKFLHLQNKTVLVTSHTHSSIDNILLKLNGIEYLRFGSLSSIDKRLHENCFSRLIETCSTMEDIKRLYSRKVMASTCLGMDIDKFDRIRFDVCIMDESSQVMQVEAIRPLLFCQKFVLIGDSKQLPPVVKKPEAIKLGMNVSIFERLESNEKSIVSLTQQYRMNEALNKLANDFTYEGILKCGNSTISQATLNVAGVKTRWISQVLSSEMEKSIIFVDTSGCENLLSPDKRMRNNPLEAGIIGRLVTELITRGIQEEDIGVVSPFCSQIQLLTMFLRSLKIPNVQVSTVDQYQGRDKDVMMLSCVKRVINDRVDGHILNDHRRLTVAITRAKVKLIIIGDAKSLSVYSPLKKLLSLLTENQIVRLKNGENDFSFDDLSLDNCH